MAKREAKLTHDVLLKRLVRRPLPRTSRSFGLLPVTLLPASENREMRTMKIIHVLAAMSVIIGAPVVARMTFITTKMALC